MKDSFHLRLVAQSYGLSYETIRTRAIKAGIKGSYVTNDQAYDIATSGTKPAIIAMKTTIEALVMPSKGNYIEIDNLPDWPTT